MGLMLRYNLFHNTSATAVYESFASFYEKRGRPLKSCGGIVNRIDVHWERNDWVIVNLDSGWEWQERREAQLFVSDRLRCAGFLVFVYDGDYWGYEFFDKGKVLDHFVQDLDPPIGFPGEYCVGNPGMLAEHLNLRSEDIAPYLVQFVDWDIQEWTNAPVRPGDEYCRFDECSVLDFLRMLGVGIQSKDQHVCLESPVFRSAYNQGRTRGQLDP